MDQNGAVLDILVQERRIAAAAKCLFKRLLAGLRPEFRRQMVDPVRAGSDPDDLAGEFEPTAQSIRTWVAQAERSEADARGRSRAWLRLIVTSWSGCAAASREQAAASGA